MRCEQTRRREEEKREVDFWGIYFPTFDDIFRPFLMDIFPISFNPLLG